MRLVAAFEGTVAVLPRQARHRALDIVARQLDRLITTILTSPGV